MLPSGVQGLFENRVNWARTYMKKSALIEATKRGIHRITKRGLDVLKNKPDRIDGAFLANFQEFKDFKALRHNKEEEETPELDLNNKTPKKRSKVPTRNYAGILRPNFYSASKHAPPHSSSALWWK